jgi:hypothetical protein
MAPGSGDSRQSELVAGSRSGCIRGKTLPTDPNPLEVSGIIANLKQAKPPKVSRPSLTEADFLKELEDLTKRAKKAGITAVAVNNLLEQAIAVAYGAPGARVTREKAPIYRTAGDTLTDAIPADVFQAQKGQK